YEYMDRCQNDEVKVCEMCRAGKAEIEQILEIADSDPAGWRKLSLEQRHEILTKAANKVAEMRGDLIGCMSAVTGKTIVEADVEVSEGVDYARFYTTSVKKFMDLGTVDMAPKGTILVISPWNFPCAIPLGGVCAALATGNTCILKPATVAAPVAWLFAQALWDAGVPKEAFQVCITDREALNVLTSSPVVKHTILTGGTDTAQSIIRHNPEKPLSAETGGKNVMIITASADRDHATMNACASAFGNAGQKCSACSLLLVEESVYNDKQFQEKMVDCATSYKVGSVWNKGNIVGPMITNTNEKLLKAISTLEPGESWLVAPRWVDEKHYILAPTVKWGVRPGNFSFRTELFGPMLSVCPVKDLKEAVELVNSLDYGLTSGVQSLDEKEQLYWRDHIDAGNLYINRGITGAIVNRQPFGGMKLSAFGGGIKAGGPNYVAQFMQITDKPGAVTDWEKSYHTAFDAEFSKPRDWNHCIGEQNLFRYLPVKSMALRLFEGDSIDDVKKVVTAAKITGAKLTISTDAANPLAVDALGVPVVKETLAEFMKGIKKYERIRTLSANVPKELWQAAADNDRYIASLKPMNEGRLELINYIKEQSIAFEYHRYGSMPVVPEDK
ncbi:MAG: aldehyde dehydrogenase family protein, partial [Bacteroidaceae bacterium]|nr:aldehyde dehydrogenase family protein [Bacteroidaceae bacterium]